MKSCLYSLFNSLTVLSSLKGIITLILATDMARHGEILDKFKPKVETFDFSNEEHKISVSKINKLQSNYGLFSL